MNAAAGQAVSHLSPVDVLAWLQSSSLSHAIAKSNHMLVATFQIMHVFGFIFLLAPLILIALRILGLVLRDQPLESLIGQCKTLSAGGLALSLASGVLMFMSAPSHYYFNWAFDAKMALLVAALAVYGLLFQWVAARGASHPLLAKINVSLSILLWLAVCMAGRAIGFV